MIIIQNLTEIMTKEKEDLITKIIFIKKNITKKYIIK